MEKSIGPFQLLQIGYASDDSSQVERRQRKALKSGGRFEICTLIQLTPSYRQSKADFFYLVQLYSTAFTNISSATAEIVHVGGHYTVKGHSRSLILVPNERPYVTSY